MRVVLCISYKADLLNQVLNLLNRYIIVCDCTAISYFVLFCVSAVGTPARSEWPSCKSDVVMRPVLAVVLV